MDGIQIATGATFGKTLIEKTSWGKLAATFWYPGKSATRYALKADFLDAFGKLEFFAYRKRGVQPSGIPAAVTQEAIGWTLGQDDAVVYAIKQRPDFAYQPPKGSFTSRCARRAASTSSSATSGSRMASHSASRAPVTSAERREPPMSQEHAPAE